MTDTDWSFVPTSVLCTFHLLLGMLIGYTACYFARPDSMPQPAAAPDVRQFRSALDGLLSQVKQLASLSQSHSPALPSSLLEAIARLIESISGLQVQAAGQNAAAPRAGKMRADPPQSATPKTNVGEPEAFAGLTGALYEELTRSESVAGIDEDPLTVRRPYEVPQYLAVWNGTLPQPRAYREVQCHDLSSNGISFFVDELPTSRYVIITLGHDHELLMQAEVVNHQRRQRDRAFVYLVGCRFTQRFEEVPENRRPVMFQMFD